MRSAIIFIACLALAAVGNALQLGSHIPVKDPTCNNPQQFDKCTDAFFPHFGDSNPHAASDFENEIAQYLTKNGQTGFANIKTWVQTLQTCAGGVDNYNACVQWPQLMSYYNFTKDNAQQWSIAFLILGYETGPGYDVISHNFYCIQNVESHINATVQMCLKRFNDEQHNDPNHICQHLAEYLYCIDRPYAQNCGKDVGNTICNVEKISYLVLFPQCQSQVALHCGGGSGR